MFAEARRLCDDDGGGGLRPRDVDMVGSQVLKSFSGVCGTASKGENSRSRGPRGGLRDVFQERHGDKGRGCWMIVTMMAKLKLLHDSRNTKLHSLSGVAITPIQSDQLSSVSLL